MKKITACCWTQHSTMSTKEDKKLEREKKKQAAAENKIKKEAAAFCKMATQLNKDTGSQFFNVRMEGEEGNLANLELFLNTINANPGASQLAKMVLAINTTEVFVFAHVPDALLEKQTPEDWLVDIQKYGGSIVNLDANTSRGTILDNTEAYKLSDSIIADSFQKLKNIGLYKEEEEENFTEMAESVGIEW